MRIGKNRFSIDTVNIYCQITTKVHPKLLKVQSQNWTLLEAMTLLK